jgi:hypothetical protein
MAVSRAIHKVDTSNIGKETKKKPEGKPRRKIT